MITMRITPADLAKLKQQVTKVAGDKEKEAAKLIRRYALLIVAEAKRLAPVNKAKGAGGQLRANIVEEVNGLTADVVARMLYAKFVEFGTGRRGAASGVAKPNDYNYGPKPGMKAQPFLFPAFEKYREEFIRELRALGFR